MRRAQRTARAAVFGACLVLAPACAGTPRAEGGDTPRPSPDLQFAAALERFDACEDVLRWFQDEALKRVGPSGLAGSDESMPLTAAETNRRSSGSDMASTAEAPNAAPAAQAAKESAGVSTTNVQEAGVDEPDIVKTDGRRLVSVAGDELRVIDLTGPSPTLAGRVSIGSAYDARVFLRGDRVLAISQEPGVMYRGVPPESGDRAIRPTPRRPSTRLTLVDIAEPAKPTVTRSIVVDGTYVDARLAGATVRLVTSWAPQRLGFVQPTGGTEQAGETARRTNEQVIRDSTIEDWLPRVRPGDARPDDPGASLVPCERVHHPKEFSGLDTLSVLSLDVDRDPLDTSATVGLVAGGHLVYASERSLYVGTTVRPDTVEPRTQDGSTAPGTAVPDMPRAPFVPPPPSRTAVHAFGIAEPGPATYRASGQVEGTVPDRWALSEHAGHLRVVSTTGTAGCRACAGEQSQVSVLAERDGRLAVVGTAGDMGRGERVQAVRFAGDTGFVVTFRQVDPFYVLDLKDPTRPQVVGELKVPGFSAYLHPVADGLVLGVGQDATERGRTTGTKIALYDVSDPSRPREVGQRVLPGTWSEVQQDTRAFLWWAPTRLAVVPVVDTGGPLAGVGVRVDEGTVREVGRIRVERSGPRLSDQRTRNIVAGDHLLTVASNGVRTSDLDTLAPEGWLGL